MPRWIFILTLFLAGIPASAAERPNVLFILCDDLRWDCLSCAGHPHLNTPNIDRLAREGVHFKNAFCTTSLCSPSRASILSGQYAHTHGVMNNFTEYPGDLASFPRALHDTGYATSYFGKWHMGEDNDSRRPGFDYFVTHKGQGKYFDNEFNIAGKREVVKGYYTSVVTEMAEQWIDQQEAGKPWLCMLGHKAPHSFYVPHPKHAKAFDDVEVKYPDTAFKLEDKPGWIKQRLGTWHGIYGPLFDFRKKFPDSSPAAVKDFESMTRAYWSTILSVDDSVGRLLKLLEKRNELENTLVIFMGDNGLLNGEHGMVDKRAMHEPSIRVPILARHPSLGKRDRPKAINQLVLTIDMAPSILELCQAPPLKNIQGRSWVSLVQKGDPNWRKSFLYYYNYEKQFSYTPNVRGVRTEEWKFIHYPHGDGSPDKHMAELYDLKNDPGERVNLARDPRQATRQAELRAELERLKKELGLEKDPMPLDLGIGSALPDPKIR
ncbi:MAG: DUF4976 domain-containing protein [Gemmataceae bacterium]|nr:DUF4976 domain-containing protein [Gemmataceae bacterium]